MPVSDTSETYVKGWSPAQATNARQSPSRVVPLVLELVPARSVADVGCGLGAWLAEFHDQGVPEILGLEGDWIDEATEGTRGAHLHVPRERLHVHDLARPFEVTRRFDLAISLEVGEHLPPEAASTFVTTLTSLAPVVLFSAAVPHQGGTGHVNEQWPPYWAALFAEHGFQPLDVLRGRLWDDDEVAWYYRQNLMLFASDEGLERFPALARARESAPAGAAALVHPHRYLQLARLSPVRARETARGTLRERLPRVAGALTSAKRRLDGRS